MKYYCQVCGESFKSKSGLSNHILQQPTTHPSLEDYYIQYVLKHSTTSRKYNNKIEFIGIFTGYVKKRKRPKGKYKCKVCDLIFPSKAALAIHVRIQYKKGFHPSPEDYYLSYLGGEKGFCKKCGKPTKFLGIFKGYNKYCEKKRKEVVCYICGKKFSKFKDLSVHLGRQAGRNMHPIPEEYYVRILGHRKGKCKECGRDTNFKSMSKGFYTFCSIMCMIKNKEIINKRKKTNIRKYGVDNPFNVPDIQNKIKEFNKKRLGVEYPLQSEEFRKKLADKVIDRLNKTITNRGK